MLITQNYKVLAFSLSAIAGFTDAISYTVLFQIFTANMSGNSVAFGLHAGNGEWGEAIRKIYPVFWFFIGIIAGNLLIKSERLHKKHCIHFSQHLLVELILILLFFLFDMFYPIKSLNDTSDFIRYFILTLFPSMAMGVQAAGLQVVNGQKIRTTVITGMLTEFGKDLTTMVLIFVKKNRKPTVLSQTRQPILKTEFKKAQITGGIVLVYTCSAFLSGYLQVFLKTKAILFAIAILMVLFLWQYFVENNL